MSRILIIRPSSLGDIVHAMPIVYDLHRHRAGVEIDWGEVTEFVPPDLLAYRWHLRRDRADATDVRIRFVPTEPGRTRVDIEHHGWERLGADGPVWRERNQQGWRTLLPHYVEAAATG